MKIEDLFEESSSFIIDNKYGILKANWNDELENEEGEGYIPKGYNKRKVLELQSIEAKEIGKGYGDKLMKEFLSSSIAKNAELIFLDPNPYIGKFENSKIPDYEQIEKLQQFYAKYGFKNNPKSNRMWLVQKGSIPQNKLPT